MTKKRHILTVEVDEQTYQNIMTMAETDDRSYGYIVRKILQQGLSGRLNSSKKNLVGTGIPKGGTPLAEDVQRS